jgi:DNA-directed RNA polymerase specialized sigma24 family protein
MPAVDHFPSTHGTWIDQQIARAAVHDVAHGAESQSALRQHLMERYYEPLCIYVKARPLIALGEPADIVGDFFARDFDAVEFLRRWRESGMTLRRWVMNAMALHCRGLMRDAARASRRRDHAADVDDVPGSDAGAERAFDRTWALGIARRAFWIAQSDAEARGRSQDALVFRRHAIDGLGHDEIARQLGMTTSQSSNACRRVSARMREAIGDLLRQDGVLADRREAAIVEVLALVREAGAQ